MKYTPAEINAQIEKAFNQACQYLTFCPRSESEVRAHLKKKARAFCWSEEIIELAIQKLKELKYVDDEEFIRWFVERRHQAKSRSRQQLLVELTRRGISRAAAEAYFGENEVSETDAACSLLSRKIRLFDKFGERERRERIVGYLSRRGFSYEAIKQALARFGQKE